jgi:iron complex outermembrane receptor protein
MMHRGLVGARTGWCLAPLAWLTFGLAHGAAQDIYPAQPAAAADRVTVTGSSLRRADIETPSPVQVLTSQDLQRSGYSSVADVLKNLTASNMGAMSQALPSANSAGASGISLRGLTVGATLVLIDGHRMATYPLQDDGRRGFVDIASLPMDAIERIEVLKDGASAIYGSDAIAGVVNVILKKTLVGTTIRAETGISAHGDGRTRHASFSKGWGDLAAEGHNVYMTFEARHQDSVLLKNRPFLAVTDWTRYGGVNLTQGTASGAPSGASSGGGSGTGYLTDANGKPIYYFPGCNATLASSNGCGYANPYVTIQPETSNLDFMARGTQNLGSDWQLNLQGSVFSSEARQAGSYNNAASTGVGSGANGGGVNLFKFGPGVGPTPAFPNQFPFVLSVPGHSQGNASANAAPLVYDFPDLGPLTQDVLTHSYRSVAELHGSLGAWDLDAAAGYTRVVTRAQFDNYISFPALQAALDDGSYQVAGGNSAAVRARVAPAASSSSTNELVFLSLSGSGDLMQLGGGALGIAAGLDFTHRALDAGLPASFASGIQNIGIYSFAQGDETVMAGHVEVSAPLTRQLELNAALRADHYHSFGTAVTPKLGLKFSPWRTLAVRGTYGRGFRAPNPGETGRSGSTAGFVGDLYDPLYCPGGAGPVSKLPAGVMNPCQVALQELQLSAPHLSPEKSDSYTLGLIVEPGPDFSATLDWYRISIRNQIISVGQLGQIGLDHAASYGTVIYRDAAGNILYDTYPFINADRTTTSGIDIELRAAADLGRAGRLKGNLQLTYMMNYDLSEQGVTYHLAGTHGPAFVSEDTGTPRTRAAFTLDWDRSAWGWTATINYLQGYSVTDPSYGLPDCASALQSIFPDGHPPARFCHVASFTELNLSGRYDLSAQWQIHAGVSNLLNRKAPLDLQTFGSAGGGAQQGGAPYNPAFHQDGAIGPLISLGMSYNF